MRSQSVFRIVVGMVAALLLPRESVTAAEGPGGAAWTQPARYRFEYVVDLPKLPQAQRLRVWVPYPAENVDQHVLSADVKGPWPHRVTEDGLGNRIVYMEGASVASRPLTLTYVVERRPSTGLSPRAIVSGSANDPQRFRHADKLVPISGQIRRLAKMESAGLKKDPDKVRVFYSYVVTNLRYDKDGAGWGRGDAIWACNNKRGNCTDFHSLFIGMVRSQGIPARFQIGFPIPADSAAGPISGYHCWAEFYDAQSGWLPVDASEAKKTGWTDAFYGTLPNDRIQFSTGRDLELEPPQDGEPLNYFIYPYVEADGAVVEHVAATYRFERLKDLPPPVSAARD